MLQVLRSNELLRRSFFAIGIRLIGAGSAFLFFIALSRLYSAQIMGMVSLTITVIMILSVIARLGIDTLTIKQTSEYVSHNKRGQLKSYMKKSSFLIFIPSIIFSFLLFVFAQFIAVYVFKNSEMTSMLQFGSIAIMFLPFHYNLFQCIRGFKKTNTYTFLKEMGVFFFALILLIGAWYFEFNPILAYLGGLLICVIIGLFVAYTLIGNVASKKTLSARNILVESYPLLLASSILLIVSWVDILMLGYFESESVVAVYAACAQLVQLCTLMWVGVNAFSAPKIAELHAKGNKKDLKAFYLDSRRKIRIYSIPIFIGLVVLGYPLLFLYGSQFTFGLGALYLLMIGQFFNIWVGSVGYLLQMTSNQKCFQYAVVVGGILNITLNLILIPLFSIFGAALASMISMGVWNLLSLYFVKKLKIISDL